MRTLLAFCLTVLLVVSCSQIPTTTALPTVIQPEKTTESIVKSTTVTTQATPTQTPVNDYGNLNLKAGNPSKASPDIANIDNYLLLKPQYVLSYSKSRNLANWAAWELNKSWMGDAKCQNDFRPDASLPKGWYQVITRDYTGSGFDRGHLVNSEDRGQSVETNSSTFLMPHIVPQAPDNNKGVWVRLEEYPRDLAREGKELYIVAGGHGIGGEGKNGDASLLKGKVTVPKTMWKVILVLDDPAKGWNQSSWDCYACGWETMSLLKK